MPDKNKDNDEKAIKQPLSATQKAGKGGSFKDGDLDNEGKSGGYDKQGPSGPS